MPLELDVLIIGAGQAATPLALKLAGAGRRVAVAEQQHLGGSCVNFGCTPTKAAIASATLAHRARTAADLGVRIPTVDVDFPAVIRRARAMAERGRNVLEHSFRDGGPRLLRGRARITGRDGDRFRAEIGGRAVIASQVVLDTGTRSTVPPIDGLDSVPFLTAETWLEQDALPEHLAIIGGGYIGLEMAQFYRRMGSAVTVIEAGERIASHEDAEICDRLQSLLADEGVAFRLGARAARVTRDGSRVTLHLDGSAAGAVEASHLLVAIGRTPNTDGLGLEQIGVRLDDRGIVEVDERLATRCPGVWAVGDIRGGPMFTHTAWDDHRILLSQLLGDGRRTLPRTVPYAIFTDPELGRVGMTEAEARAAGRPVRTACADMDSNGRAREMAADRGMIKVVVDAESERILGAAVLATAGAELVHIYATAMASDLPYRAISDAIHIHPTLAEAVQSVLSELD